MKGTIRTKAVCLKCGGRFENIEDRDLMCRKCFLTPEKFYIGLYWNGKQRKIYFDNRGQSLSSYNMANSTLKEIHERIENHTFDPCNYKAKKDTTLQFEIYARTFFSRLEQAHKGGKYSPNTIRSFKNDIFNHIVPYFNSQEVRDIRAEDLERFYSNLPERLSLSTRKHIFMVLHLILKDAIKRKDISIIPLFPIIIVPEPQTRWIDEATQDIIYEKIPNIHKPIFIFMMKQGVRPGEARALHWEDINIKQRTVEIHRTFAGRICQAWTKTKRNRLLPLDDSVFDMLRQGCGSSGFVFTTSRGTPYTEATVLNKIWGRAVKSAGLKHVKLYEGTRHSFLSQAANAGVDAFQLQKFAGHTNSKITEKYIHINIEALQMVLDKKKRNSF